MTVTIAISGKGGTGKTIIASTLLKILTNRYPDASILAIDANLNGDLGRYVGQNVINTIYDLRVGNYKYPYGISDDMSKQEYIDACIQDLATPFRENVDLIAAGSPVTLQCTCYTDKIIRDRMETFAQNYDIVVIDSADDIVYLKNIINITINSIIIIADSSRSAITSAARLKYAAREMLLHQETTLLLNKIRQRTMPDEIKKLIDKYDLDIVGIIPYDEDLRSYEYAGYSIFELDTNSPVCQSIEQTLYRLNLHVS